MLLAYTTTLASVQRYISSASTVITGTTRSNARLNGTSRRAVVFLAGVVFLALVRAGRRDGFVIAFQLSDQGVAETTLISTKPASRLARR